MRKISGVARGCLDTIPVFFTCGFLPLFVNTSCTRHHTPRQHYYYVNTRCDERHTSTGTAVGMLCHLQQSIKSSSLPIQQSATRSLQFVLPLKRCYLCSLPFTHERLVNFNSALRDMFKNVGFWIILKSQHVESIDHILSYRYRIAHSKRYHSDQNQTCPSIVYMIGSTPIVPWGRRNKGCH